MEQIIIISSFCIVFWVFYAKLEGIREGFYYDAAMRADRQYQNIHWIFFVQRALILLVICMCTLSVLLPIGLGLMFPFIHDGYYYITRNHLDPRIYPKKFISSSTTSTAFLEIDFTSRVIFFIGGIVFILAHYLLIIYTT